MLLRYVKSAFLVIQAGIIPLQRTTNDLTSTTSSGDSESGSGALAGASEMLNVAVGGLQIKWK